MSDLKLALVLTADGKQLITTVNGVKTVISDLNGHLNRTETAGNNAAQGLAKVQHQGDVTGKALQRVSRYAAGAFAGLSAINLGQKISSDLAAFQDVRTRLQTLSGSTAAYAANEAYLINLTREHHKALIPLADNYAALLNLQDSGLVTQAQARALLEGMSNAQSALGASSAQLGQSLYGLSQALASPIVRAEELNQLVEPLPGLLNKMDKAAGLSAGGFRQMVLAGTVTSEFLRNHLITALHEYDGAAAATAANISAQSRDMNNAYQQLIVAFETPINSSLTSMLSSLTAGLQWSTDNAELLIDMVGVALASAMGRGAAAIASVTVATLAKISADNVAYVSTLKAAHAELHRATIQRNAVLTSGQAVVAEARLTAARNALTAATNRATLATRAMNGVMSLAGGPAGVLMMAAAGIAYFGLSAKHAQFDISDLDDEVDVLLGRMDNIKSRKLDLGIEKQKQKIAEMNAEYIKLAYAPAGSLSLVQRWLSSNDELRTSQRAAAKERAAQITVLSHKLEQAKQDLIALNGELTKLDASGSPSAGTTSPSMSKIQQQLLDSLTKQKHLYGEVSEAAKVRYEIEYGTLKKLDPAINAQILLEAKALDAKKQATTSTQKAADAMKEQETQLKSLLSVLDPISAASNEMADKERLLKTYFEQANVPLEKRRALLAALKEEYAAPQQRSEFEQLRGNLDPTFSENQTHTENMGILTDELANTPESEVFKRNQINLLIEAEQLRHAKVMKQINGDVSLNWDQLWNDSVSRMAAGIGSATADAIFEAKDFGQATMQVLKGVGKAATQMLVEYMVQKALAATKDTELMGVSAAAATTTAAGTGASITASMAPAAATASIATMGGAPSIGMIALMAGMALIPSIIGQFHGGGTIPREGTYLLDGGETVYTRNQQQTLMNAMKASSGSGQGGRRVSIEQHNTIVVKNQSDVDTLEQVLPELVALTKSAVVDDLNQRGDVWQAGA